MATKATTCIWFDGQIEEAAEFYTSLVPDSEIVGLQRYPEGLSKPVGDPLVIDFTIAGAPFQLLNGGPEFSLSAVVSIVLEVDDQAEVDRLWETLTGDGGAPGVCGWLTDRFGLSWQIVPRRFNELLTTSDPDTARRITEAMLQMRKLEVSVFEEIAAGGSTA
jgi:predicted 3-demethylubiquinone-9 3-methyltransferase (glyoxalase superfamily)